HYALTTELSYGVPLSYLLKTKDKNPIPDAAKAHISAQICLFLEMANEAGIVHCDIKPDNIVVDPETYNIKIIDFGIAKLVDKKHHYKSPKDTGDLVRKEFNEGTVIGSPHYMAPEQRAGKKLTFKTDLFGTGRTLIELWTGELNAIKGLYSNEDHQQTVRRLENLGLQKSVVTAIVEMLYVEPKYRDDNYARTKFKEMSTGPKPPLDISMEKYLQESDDYTLTMVTRAEDHSQQKAQLQQGIAYLDTIDAKTLDVNIVKLNKIMLKEKPAIIKKTVIESSYRRRPEPTRETVVLYAP
ncbi:MAG: protein kinase, partial [Nanoarchaeota archaeon]|nr:protein kinase [Nanoarchaeota archaeon]